MNKMRIITIAVLAIAISTAFAQNSQNQYSTTYSKDDKPSYMPPSPSYQPSGTPPPPNYEANQYRENQLKTNQFGGEKLPPNEFRTGDNSTVKVTGSTKSVKGTYREEF